VPDRNSMKWKDENAENALLKNDDLYHAALDEFSKKSFHEASLNDILKAVRMNKGSFYYRFYDKMDLYLSLFHRVGMGKLAFFQEHFAKEAMPEGFFDQIRLTAKLGLLYARQEIRCYLFWKNYLGEDEFVHHVVKENFSELADDRMDEMIAAAISKGELSPSYNPGFVASVIKLLIYNLDTLLTPGMDDEDILNTVDELTRFMKNGL
jgi:TetR/AcrR family transcriptional regulator